MNSTKKLFQKLSPALQAYWATNKNQFVRLEIIGTAKTMPHPSDIDILMILSDRHDPAITLEGLRHFFDGLRKEHQFSVLSESLFLPFLHAVSDLKTPIIHVIPFISKKHYDSSLFSLITTDSHVRRQQAEISVTLAGDFIAISDALRCWLLRMLNTLPKTNSTFVHQLQLKSISRVSLSPRFKNGYLLAMAKFLSK